MTKFSRSFNEPEIDGEAVKPSFKTMLQCKSQI